jgi:uncharacterized protein (TIGR02996 family)
VNEVDESVPFNHSQEITLNDENGFFCTLEDNPADETARLVYADWLDEQGEPNKATKAEFIRLELRVLQEDHTEPTDSQRLQQLAAGIEPDWLAIVSRPRVEYCQFLNSNPCARRRYLYAPTGLTKSRVEACHFLLTRPCPGRWDLLAPTGLTKLRLCETCYKTVNFCTTPHEKQEYVRQGNRIAVSPGIALTPNDLHSGRPMKLTAEMIERLREASRRGAKISLAELQCERFQFPQRPTDSRTTQSPATEIPDRNKQPTPEQQAPLPKRREGGRVRNRNIQREDWEEQE